MSIEWFVMTNQVGSQGLNFFILWVVIMTRGSKVVCNRDYRHRTHFPLLVLNGWSGQLATSTRRREFLQAKLLGERSVFFLP